MSEEGKKGEKNIRFDMKSEGANISGEMERRKSRLKEENGQ